MPTNLTEKIPTTKTRPVNPTVDTVIVLFKLGLFAFGGAAFIGGLAFAVGGHVFYNVVKKLIKIAPTVMQCAFYS